MNITRGGGVGIGNRDTGQLEQTIGSVNWIGTDQDSVKALENIHVTAYTIIEKNPVPLNILKSYDNYPNTFYVGIYVTVSPNRIAVPEDAIDYAEIIIPNLGVETPSYTYKFTLSVPS